ncbi:MAG: hypothetical protein IPN17_19920 [Deltaproteobacteria bacterium]|nr:hypothetical protein [Deltaproteobacteria bacterium]
MSPVPRVLAALATLALSGPAWAQRPLRSSDFAIDFSRGPVVGPGRAVGLGGAYGSLVSGVDGVPFNPAGYAERSGAELSWFSFDPVVSFFFPQRNWDNSGAGGRDYDSFRVTQLGLGMHFGPVGVGYLATIQSYELGARNGLERPITVDMSSHHLGGGLLLGDGEVVIGAGLRIGSMNLQWSGAASNPDSGNALRYVGVAPEFGALWRPTGQRFRLGMAFRSEVSALPIDFGVTEGGTVRRPTGCVEGSAGCFVVPRRIALPWEVEIGASVMLGERPFNIPWQDMAALRRDLRDRQRDDRARREREHRIEMAAIEDDVERASLDARWTAEERERREREEREYASFAWRWRAARRVMLRDRGRRFLLISFSLVAFGPVKRGQGIDAFMAQQERPSGRGLLLSPRLGLEGEPWANRLQIRAGSYVEPSRFDDVPARVHVTGGLDLRLFRWDTFKISDPVSFKLTFTMDYSYNYFDWGFGIGFWQ